MNKTIPKIEFGNPILRSKTKRLAVEEIRSDEVQQLIRDMQYALRNRKYGVGLAANQVGKDLALSVIATKPSPTRPDIKKQKLIIINPVILKTYDAKSDEWEGCISSPKLYAQVPRYKKIRLKWLDAEGEPHERDFDGLMAHVIQHEVDHLNGILFVDKVENTKSYMTFKEYRKMLQKYS